MKVALLQMNSQLDPETNLSFIRSHADALRIAGVEALFLPECFLSFAGGEVTPHTVSAGNALEKQLCALPRELGVAIYGGSVTYREGEKYFNRVYNLSAQGEILSTYDKIHLFDCDLSNMKPATSGEIVKKTYTEGQLYTPGKQLVVQGLGLFTVGLGVCFDVRFPEMFREYGRRGCNVLSLSAAFTVPTGKAHWHTLMRARAIENQSYVIAAAQSGTHNGKVQTFGHSVAIDPWGEILIDGGEGTGLHIFELDQSKLQEVKKRMKVFE
jgi:predicted amidohydrolase